MYVTKERYGKNTAYTLLQI